MLKIVLNSDLEFWLDQGIAFCIAFLLVKYANRTGHRKPEINKRHKE